MIDAKFKITFTNLIGAIGFAFAIYKGYDYGVGASAVLILGRAGFEKVKYFRKNDK
jgi:cytochrome bd-type quinol oxidase subunit 2